MIKPVLMLAEHEAPGGFMIKGFDMNYAWELHHLMNSVAQGKAKAKSIINYFDREWATYPNNVYRLQFLTNHDENSWAGTIDSLMGDAQRMFATMIFTAQAVPLIYSGQEACLDKKLKFFERDPIVWKECDLTGFYENLIKLKKENKALWNGDSGGPMVKIKTGRDKKVFGFSREKDGNRVLVFLNLKRKSVKFKARLDGQEGDYSDFFTGTSVKLGEKEKITLEPWGYKVFVR
jgi:glycosidase